MSVSGLRQSCEFADVSGRVMQSRPLTPNESRALLIDVHTDQGGRLVEQLNRAGFRTDLTVSWSAARGALAANFYHSCVVVANLNRQADLDQLDVLRRAALRVWIIVVSDLPTEDALVIAHRQGVDAVITAPFSVQDLTSRLAAFALRARPAF